MANEGFGYPPTRFFYEHDEDFPGLFNWNAPIDCNYIPTATVYSSCRGLVACRRNSTTSYSATSTYSVGNPFLPDSAGNIIFHYRHLPPPPTPFHLPASTHVVLAVDFRYPASYLLVCALRGAHDALIFEAFDSSSYEWRRLVPEARFDRRADIVPHSGVSCGRSAYWLLSDSPRVLRFRFGDGAHSPPSASILNLPPHLASNHTVRMKLGRAMGRLCLVVARESTNTVELHSLNLQAAAGASPWSVVDVFNVEVRAADADAGWRQEDKTIVCGALPYPMRFDSFKIQLLFWVPGGAMMLENSAVDPLLYRLRSAPLPLLTPNSVLNGVPHVGTDLNPKRFRAMIRSLHS